MEVEEITITEDAFIPFCLDAGEHPERYAGKKLRFELPLEIRMMGNGDNKEMLCGRAVMTCCMADIQFMGCVLCPGAISPEKKRGWGFLHGSGRLLTEQTGQKRLGLSIDEICPAPLPDVLIMTAGS